jgi:hypothetical protein
MITALPSKCRSCKPLQHVGDCSRPAQNLWQCQQDQQGIGGFCSPTSDFKPDQPDGLRSNAAAP